MANRRKIWMALGAAAALATGAIAVAPATSWIVRQQTIALESMLLSPSLAQVRLWTRDTERRAEAVRQHPDDVNLQIEFAGNNSAALEALSSRYPASPSLQAAILRDLSREKMNLNGRNTDAATLVAPTREPIVNYNTVTTGTAQLWEQAATTGERIDPNNAFFPYLHAVGLFAAHRDDAACAEIVRAGSLPTYNDYTRDVTMGGWRLADATNRMESGSLAKIAIQAGMLLPHFSVMRGAARLATAHAVTLEQAGQAEQGFIIRRGLERSGARMRTDSSWIICGLVGQAIGSIAWSRPGGAPPLPKNVRESSEARAAAQVQLYEAYLRQIGHPEEIAWVDYHVAVRNQQKQYLSAGLELGPFGMGNMLRILALWGGSAILLGNLFFVLILGGIAALLMRTAVIRADRPLKPLASAIAIAIVAGSTLYLANSAAQTLGAYAATGASLVTSSGMPGANSDSGNILPGLLAMLFVMLVPGVMALAFAIRSRRRGVPMGAGVVRGFASTALPTAAVLALLYVVLIALTGQLEMRSLRLMQESNQNEGKTIARLTGHEWPAFGPDGAR